MPFSIEETAIPAVKIIRAKRFGDTRGYFLETWSGPAFAELGIAAEFVQDNQSRSAERFTVRGLHFQRAPRAQAKLLRVIAGAILDVAVDIRAGSPSFGRHVAVTLSADKDDMLLVPRGFAHGFCTLEPGTVVAYKVDDLYSPADEGGVLWWDPALGIDWPCGPKEATVSGRDETWPRLAALRG